MMQQNNAQGQGQGQGQVNSNSTVDSTLPDPRTHSNDARNNRRIVPSLVASAPLGSESEGKSEGKEARAEQRRAFLQGWRARQAWTNIDPWISESPCMAASLWKVTNTFLFSLFINLDLKLKFTEAYSRCVQGGQEGGGWMRRQMHAFPVCTHVRMDE